MPPRFKIITDTSDFFRVEYNDVVVLDAAGNNVRILEFIRGPRFDEIELVTAIKFLHDHGEKHGDLRRDHILVDSETGINRWIDFDYNYRHGESLFGFDLHGLGNIIIFLTGRGDVLVPDLYHHQRELFDTLWGEDLSIAYKNRVLLHFSQGANIFYETTDQLLDDLARARADVVSLSGRQP